LLQGKIGLSSVVNVLDDEAAKENELLAKDDLDTVTPKPDNMDEAGAHAKQVNREKSFQISSSIGSTEI
jgi:hypothetical protein